MPDRYEIAGIRFEALCGDITQLGVDAIVVGKDSSSFAGGGVFNAIVTNSTCCARFRRECQKPAASSLTRSSAVLIHGCGLRATHIILVPLPSTAEEAVLSVVAAIDCAHTNGLESIALPLLGGFLLTTRKDNDERVGKDSILRRTCNAIAKCVLQIQSKRSNLKTIGLMLNSDALKKLAVIEFDRIFSDPSLLVQTQGIVIAGSNGLPPQWTPLEDGNIFSFVQLSHSTREFIDIENEVKKAIASLGKWTLHAVYRVQNPTLFKQFISYREKLEKKYSASLELQMGLERSLFHGTRADAVGLIAEHGFDRSYSGHVSFGQGTYFARDMSYSAQDQYSAPGPAIARVQTEALYNRHPRNCCCFKYVFRARVLVGRVCIGSSDMRHLPTTPADSAPDCAVDNASDPSIFVIFKDAQAYPEYLLVLRNQ